MVPVGPLRAPQGLRDAPLVQIRPVLRIRRNRPAAASLVVAYAWACAASSLLTAGRFHSDQMLPLFPNRPYGAAPAAARFAPYDGI